MVNGWKAQVAMAAAAALIICVVMAYRQPGYIYEQLDRRPVPALETIEFTSESLDQIYQLYVQLPPGYTDSNTRYPVLYAVDGRPATQLYSGAVLPLMRRREISDVIIIGIGYAGNQRLIIGSTFLDSRRARDFTPVPNIAMPQSGQADTFLTFLEDKVIPFIDATYRTDSNDRSVGGYELGGLFSFYAILSRPDLFQRCLAIEPRFSWEDDHIFEVEAQIAETGMLLNASVYFASLGSDLNRLSGEAMMADTLRSRAIPGLKTEHAVASGRSQFAAIQDAVANGLRFFHEHPLQ